MDFKLVSVHLPGWTQESSAPSLPRCLYSKKMPCIWLLKKESAALPVPPMWLPPHNLVDYLQKVFLHCPPSHFLSFQSHVNILSLYSSLTRGTHIFKVWALDNGLPDSVSSSTWWTSISSSSACVQVSVLQEGIWCTIPYAKEYCNSWASKKTSFTPSRNSLLEIPTSFSSLSCSGNDNFLHLCTFVSPTM